ncbi:MAG: MBL fold metallo-hydrolase, partial [Acidobacteriota bacterium]|nr:MBL fold metallo-hydrolase [Acidobacteriota bacterium]
SRDATTSPFLRAVRPTIAVVSAGRRNVFGHPHAETLRRLRSMNVRILRTDLEGTVMLNGTSGRWEPGSP